MHPCGGASTIGQATTIAIIVVVVIITTIIVVVAYMHPPTHTAACAHPPTSRCTRMAHITPQERWQRP